MPRYRAIVEFNDPETDIARLMRGDSISLSLAPEGSRLRSALSRPERWFKVDLKKVEDASHDSHSPALVDVA